MIYALANGDGTYSEIQNDVIVGGVHIPLGNLDIWDEATRNSVGIFGLTLPVPPAGQLLQSYSIQAQNGVPVIVPVYVAIPVPPPAPLTFDFLTFMGLFTDAEKLAIIGSADPEVKLFLAMAEGTKAISLTDPRMKQGLDYLVSVNLLTADREAAILSAN